MIDKNHLRNTMLALTEAELEQAPKPMSDFSAPRGWIARNRLKMTNRAKQKPPPIWPRRSMTASIKWKPKSQR